MALTKVTGQVIKNTTDVTVGVLTVTNTLAVGGTVSIGGTLTYEDVTNIDSVGLITARNGIVVGSGITLSKDGDVFFTGIATGNGSGLTNLPAANLTGTLPAISGANLTNLDASDLASGTVPTARLGSGTASSSTFLRGDSTFAAVTSTTINSNADNRVITGSGTADTLNAESNVNISGGTLIAGHTASTTVSDGEGPFIQVKSTDSRGGISLLRHSADASGGGVYIGKSRNATIGSNTVLQNGDELGRITFSGDDGTDVHTQSAAIHAFVDGTTGSNDMPGSLRLYTNSGAGSGSSDLTERLRIDSSGRVLIGQTSSINGVYGSPPPRFSVSTTTASPAIFATYSNDVYGSRIDLIKSRATTVGGTTVVQAGDAIGEIVFGGADGDQFHPTAIIQSAVESGVGNNDMPGDLRFYTNGGATTGTERMRINSAGIITKPYNPSFMAYGDNSWTTLTDGQSSHPYNFNNIAHNIGSHYKNSGTDAGKFIAPVAGVYQLNWNIFCQGTSNQDTSATIEFYVRINGSSVSRLHNKKGYGNMGDDQQVVNIAVAEQLSANDEVTLYAAAYGATWRIYGGHTTFSGYLVQ